ncbi:MAG: nucleotide sugar dehydrogenase [Candidatus Latescibacterota bacterium]
MEAIESVGVIGMGYVGLPLAAGFAGAGLRVLGIDIDPVKVERLNAGRSYIERVPSPALAELVACGRFSASGDHARLREADAICICVPTPIDEARTPDLSAVTQTCQRVGAALRRGQLVVLESTTYPGTTDELVRPILEAASGLSAAGDFLLAFSPEREDPGNREFTLHNTPKVVGGCTPEATEAAVQLYGRIAPAIVRVSSARVAEATKMLENTYRAVNIALVNELKVIFQRLGVDIWQVIEAAKTKPFGFHAFTPGPGMGGHCIPVDPFYLSYKARTLGQEARFIELAGQVNVEMPRYVVDRLHRALDERGQTLSGALVLLLGAAYKPDIDDDRESPFYEIADLLKGRGTRVRYHDPHIPRIRPTRHHKLVLESVPLDAAALQEADATVIVTCHSTFDPAFIVRHARLVVDTRNATRAVQEGREKIVLA